MRRRVVLLVAALVVWVVGAAVGTGPSPHAAATPMLVIGRAHAAQFLPTPSGSKPVFILVLGSDARPGQPIEHERSDSIHIIGINPRKHRASILGFPRDSWVSIPGHGSDKINAAMTIGGPQLTVKTVESLTGIHIDYYMLTSFGGLPNIVNDVGGVTVDVPTPMHDHNSGANFDAGPLHMNGSQALAFARDRHSLPNGDLGRSENQGLLLLSTLAEFQKSFAKDPSALLKWIGAGMRNIHTDLSLQQVLDLSFLATEVRPGKTLNVVVPGSAGTEGGKSVVFLSSGAKALYTDMKADGLLSGAG